MAFFAPDEERLNRLDLERLQRHKLADLLAQARDSNAFYRHKLAGVDFDPLRDALDRLPLTTRAELEREQRENPPYGTNLTFPLARYCRLHQTSGSTSGAPLRWLDTAESWQWWRKCWGIIYAAAGVRPDDRFVFPFSFGPFVGFWGAFESAVAMGNLCLAAGGMTTSARLRYLLDNAVTFVCCTPTYALRMAEVAADEGLDLAASPVRGLIVAGEPGGSIPATRARIEQAWGARVFDHAGMTEIGPWGFEAVEAPGGLLVMECEFMAEVIDPSTGAAVEDGEPGELVLTNLGRVGSPLIRYRTGDQARLRRDRETAGRWFAFAEGGVLGRVDDMLVIRGNNVFPTAIEDALRELNEIAEFRLHVEQSGSLCELRIDVEPAADPPDEPARQRLAARIAEHLRARLHFRPQVRVVGRGALPRFEMKARRVERHDRPEA